jgi:hypothetical protein
MSLTALRPSAEALVSAVAGHGRRPGAHPRRTPGDPALECADAWAAFVGAGPRAGHEPRLLVRALLHAATTDLRRVAWTGGEHADTVVLAAARAFYLLRIAVRAGAYAPDTPGEVLTWVLLLRSLPAGWADALEVAAREAGRNGPPPWYGRRGR